MEINACKNVKLNVKMYSNDDLYEIEEFDCEVNQNILVVTSKICVTIDNTNVRLVFEVKSNIDLDQIDKSTYINLPIDEYKFIDSNVNPKWIETIATIIDASHYSSVLCIEDYKLPYYIKKDPSILDNLILLIDKANEDLAKYYKKHYKEELDKEDYAKYDKNDLDSVLDAYYDVVDRETHDGIITKRFCRGMRAVDPDIADKIMTSLQKIVQEEWDPCIEDGLEDVLADNITIFIEF